MQKLATASTVLVECCTLGNFSRDAVLFLVVFPHLGRICFVSFSVRLFFSLVGASSVLEKKIGHKRRPFHPTGPPHCVKMNTFMPRNHCCLC